MSFVIIVFLSAPTVHMLTQSNNLSLTLFFHALVSGKYKRKIFMNWKSEDCCINQNLKSEKKKYMGGWRRMSLLRAPKRTADLGSILQWHPGVAAAGYQQPWVQGKISCLQSPRVPGRPLKQWLAPELAHHLLLTNCTIKCLIPQSHQSLVW